jgi:hypothetical protein
MRRSVILASVALLALAGCSSGSSDEATANQSDAEASTDYSAAEAPAEAIASEVSLPQIAASCNNPESGKEVLRLVTDPSTGIVYVHNIVDEINENRYSQKSTSYAIDGNKLSFFSEFAKKDDPNRVEYNLTTGDWLEESGYNPQKRKDAEACEAREQAERADCAEAGSINACVATRYPGLKGMCYIGGDLSMTIKRSCSPLQDHNEALGAAKAAWKNSVDYWNENQ